MSKKQKTAEEMFPDRKIGDKVGNFTVVDLHRPSEGWILSRPLQALKPQLEVVAGELTILDGAFGAPIWEVYLRATWLSEDFNEDEGLIRDVLLLKISCGGIESWMSFSADENQTVEIMGEGCHPDLADQERRLKFLIKFDMDETMFNELNPPWRDYL